MNTRVESALGPAVKSARAPSRVRLFFDLFKLRIGLVIGFTAVAGIAITPGPALPGWQVLALALAVTLASAAAGAFNQYVERDLDVHMGRTRQRAFVTGRLRAGPRWLAAIVAIGAAGVLLAAIAINLPAAVYTFLGAFTYGVVYTVWLKRRTWWNIVVGGLAGSFAVLAGAAAVTPETLGPLPLAFAVVLFLWTPPHFWSLAIAFREDYEAAKVPMLPVVVGDERAARAVFAGAALLVTASLVPALLGMGWLYLAAALGGGGYLLVKTARLALAPNRRAAMVSFHASLIQLTLLLVAAIAEAVLRA
ncbi:MAG: protoheme IX farnesyltransferase [Betaproteobacteria bacterium]|nr:protoheme IX farnesyltransferase [Betaproteobacteria bacterium]